jgi:2-octaprenyl-6-methoxyphenol hydroxylase
MTCSRVKIAIVGAGPVGLSLAAMLMARGVAGSDMALIDAKTPAAAQEDPRSIALSFGSRQLLEQIQAWPVSGTPITQIHISRRGSFGRTLIDSQDYDLPALGYVCRYGTLVQTLTNVLQDSGITMLRPVVVTTIEESAQAVTLQLTDGSAIEADVLVQAEGGVYGEQAVKSRHHDYQQCAIVATVHSSAPVIGRAFERFTNEGPLALLPQDDGYALVWCGRPASAEKLLALSDADFLQALQAAFGQRVGHFIKIGARNSFPLGLNASPASTGRIVAIGNAAQTLHPVAGQGLNLGLRDATVLSSLLAQHSSPAMLSQFSSARQPDRQLTMRLTDVMARVFASAADGSFTQDLLGLSLGLLDLAPAFKQRIAQQMMFGWR